MVMSNMFSQPAGYVHCNEPTLVEMGRAYVGGIRISRGKHENAPHSMWRRPEAIGPHDSPLEEEPLDCKNSRRPGVPFEPSMLWQAWPAHDQDAREGA